MSIYPPGGGGGHSLVWPMKVCAAGQCMVLNKIESCPKLGMYFGIFLF